MTDHEALSAGILALNTLAYPDATSDASFDYLDVRTDEAIHALAALRTRLASE